MCLSLVRPTYPTDMKDMLPWGVAPMKYLIVLRLLYEEYVAHCCDDVCGICVCTSKRSTTHTAFLKLVRKHIGVVINKVSLLGQCIIRLLSRWSIIFIHFWKYLDTVLCDILNRKAKSSSVTSWVSLTKVENNCSRKGRACTWTDLITAGSSL